MSPSKEGLSREQPDLTQLITGCIYSVVTHPSHDKTVDEKKKTIGVNAHTRKYYLSAGRKIVQAFVQATHASRMTRSVWRFVPSFRYYLYGGFNVNGTGECLIRRLDMVRATLQNKTTTSCNSLVVAPTNSKALFRFE